MRAYHDYDNGGLLHNRYSKVHDISEGSYGLVSLAKDTKNKNQLVAVKYLYPPNYKKKKSYQSILDNTGRSASSPAKLHSKSSSERNVGDSNNYLNEVSIHKILGHHPHIPDLIDSFESCLVLEYCSRGDLYEAMQEDQGPTTSQDIKDVFSQIIDAISFCHSKSIYHRDLKPENILIAEDWAIKVCDWGLATTERIITNPAEFDIGSERYMAPELFDPKLEFYDASKVDVWSLGIILLTLVFQKNPFQVANYSDKRFLQFSSNREALFDFFSTMTNEMFGALRFCLNLDPSNRDLTGFRDELRNINFFTIDEEYIATHSEEDCDDEDAISSEPEAEEVTFTADEPDIDIQDEVFGFDKDPKEDALHESTGSPKDSTLPISMPQISPTKASHLQIPHGNSGITRREVEDHSDEDEVPYNKRADALLSPSTQARPIPIGGGRQIRNTRKPFGVASYNKYHTFSSAKSGQNNHSHASKFNREDFFTPRSIFSHYMDKYGEQRDQKEYARNEKRRRRKTGKQSWKKRGGWSHAPSNNQFTLTDETNVMVTHTSGRRRHSRLSMPTNGGPVPVFSPQTNLQPGANGSSSSRVSDRSKSGQKYVPPFLRSSPGGRKSPAIHAVSEAIDHLSLNDNEVFMLEDDRYGPSEPHSIRKSLFESRDFGTAFEPQSHASHRRYSTGKPEVNNQVTAKYVPPFRRGSYGGVSVGCEKKRFLQPNGAAIPIIHQAIEDEESKSVPGDSWLHRKDWKTLK